jgi:NitT/TauT family transport system permease protein
MRNPLVKKDEADDDLWSRLDHSTSKLGFGFHLWPTRRRVLLLVTQIGILAVVLIAWQHDGSSAVGELTISTPRNVLSFLWEFVSGGSMLASWQDLCATFKEAAGGYALGVVTGILLAVALNSNRWLELFAAPFVSAVNALPKIALAPLFILLFGETYISKVYFVAAGIFFLSFYNVLNGLRSIEPRFLRHVYALGGTRRWAVRDIYIPSIIGWVVASLRLSAAFALGGAVICEYLGSLQGMGHVIYNAQQAYDPAAVVGAILIVGIVALIIDRVLVQLQRRFSLWRLS